MRTIRLYQPLALAPGRFTLDEDGSQHVGRVLRCRPGDPLVLFDGSGSEYPAVIERVGRQMVEVRVGEATQPPVESPLDLILGLVMSRGERMDWAIQKACELGVSEVCPLTSRHCEVRLDDDRAGRRVGHWQKVAISASEQSGRTRVAKVRAVQGIEAWVASVAADVLLVAHPGPPSDALRPAAGPRPARVALLVGPEGGLHEAEVDQARQRGFQHFTLGPRILRTETAPMVALSLLQHVWGDLSSV